MARVQRVTVTVLMADGEEITMHEDRPSPQGDNSAFVCQQFDSGLENAGHRVRMGMVAVYGPQINKNGDRS